MSAQPLEEPPVECGHLRARHRSVCRPAARAVDQHDRRDSFGDDLGAIDREAEGDAAAHRMADDDACRAGRACSATVAASSTSPGNPNIGGTGEDRPKPRWSIAITRHPPAANGRGHQRERPHRRAVAVEQQHRAARPALLDVELTAVGGVDHMVLVLTGEAEVAIGVRVGPAPTAGATPALRRAPAPGHDRGGAHRHHHASSVHRAILFGRPRERAARRARPTDQGIGGPLDQPRSGRLTPRSSLRVGS